MWISHFFKSSWVAQLIVGICLFLCSFYLEYQIFLAFIAPPLLALALALTLETGKITAIVWHYYLDYLSFQSYPRSVRVVSAFFRIGLMVLSLLCSQLFLTAYLDRPNLEKIRSREMGAVEQRVKSELAQLDHQYEDNRKTLLAGQQQEISGRQQRYEQRINKLDALLLREMDNVVNGVFKGTRYFEFKNRLDQEKSALSAALEKIRGRHLRERKNLYAGYETTRNSILARAEKEKKNIEHNEFTYNDQVNDKHIVSFLKVVETIFHATLQPLQFVFLFSIMLSVLMETGILLAFSTITVTMAPVLMAQHQEAMEQETLAARVDGESRRSEMRHSAAVDRIFRSGKRTLRKTEEYMDAKNRSGILKEVL